MKLKRHIFAHRCHSHGRSGPRPRRFTIEAPPLLAALFLLCSTFAVKADDDRPTDFQSLEDQVQALKKDILAINRELFILEEELLFPTNTQVAVFLSLDTGTFFQLDSVEIRIDDKVVSHYLYTRREVEALRRGGIHRVYFGNLRAGEHELTAFFTGLGPRERPYRRGATLTFEKGPGPQYLELQIVDVEDKQQPEFRIKAWD